MYLVNTQHYGTYSICGAHMPNIERHVTRPSRRTVWRIRLGGRITHAKSLGALFDAANTTSGQAYKWPNDKQISRKQEQCFERIYNVIYLSRSRLGYYLISARDE